MRTIFRSSGPVADVMNVDPLNEKYESFGWNVLRINGHDMEADCRDSLSFLKHSEPEARPTALICYTKKRQGCQLYGEPTPAGTAARQTRKRTGTGARRIESRGRDSQVAGLLCFMPRSYQVYVGASGYNGRECRRSAADYWWNPAGTMKVEMKPTRAGFGQALRGGWRRLPCLLPSWPGHQRIHYHQ